MRVVGIDPGLAACGYGVVEADGSKAEALAFGCWHTEAGARIELRLHELFVSVASLVERYRPDAVALEESFVGLDAQRSRVSRIAGNATVEPWAVLSLVRIRLPL
jgi:crossover junction endodeoxyribonuclease RuvC